MIGPKRNREIAALVNGVRRELAEARKILKRLGPRLPAVQNIEDKEELALTLCTSGVWMFAVAVELTKHDTLSPTVAALVESARALVER